MEKQVKCHRPLWARPWPKTLWRKQERRNANAEPTDVIEALAQLEEQEQDQRQEFFHLTAKIREFGIMETDLAGRLTEFLETQREWALYEALLGVLRQSRQLRN